MLGFLTEVSSFPHHCIEITQLSAALEEAAKGKRSEPNLLKGTSRTQLTRCPRIVRPDRIHTKKSSSTIVLALSRQRANPSAPQVHGGWFQIRQIVPLLSLVCKRSPLHHPALMRTSAVCSIFTQFFSFLSVCHAPYAFLDESHLIFCLRIADRSVYPSA